MNLPIGGISSVILELLPVYENIDNSKVSLITKYSEYKPQSKNTDIHIIHRFIKSKINTIYFFVKSFFRIRNIHKKNPIHVINIHSFFYDIISPLILRWLFKIPLLIKLPSDFETQQREIFMINPYSLFSRFAYYGWMKFFRKFVVNKKSIYFQAINEKIYKSLLDLNVPKERIIKIPNGISIQQYLGLEKHHRKETHFGYVGRLLKSKNIEFLLNTFSQYLEKYPQDKLYIFGKGPEHDNITKFIKKHKLQNNIILWGFEKDRLKIYRNINALIHPTFGEGCPNTILESVLSGTFVIASNVSGIKDIITNNESGLLFNPFNEQDLLNKLLFFKENPDIIPSYIDDARNVVIQKYDVEKVGLKIYQFIVSNWLKKPRRRGLNISILTPVFPYPKRGVFPGIESYVESFAIPLKEIGNNVRIVTCFWNGGNRNGTYMGIPILRIYDSKALLGKIGSIFHFNNITFGLNLYQKQNFKFFNDSDIIIMPLALGFTSFLKIKKYPVVSMFLHYDESISIIEHLTHPFYHFLEKKQFRKFQNVVTISESSKNDIIKHYNIPSKSIKVFPIGINTNRFNPKKSSVAIRKQYGKNILLYVGPFVKRKRIPILLKALTYVIKEMDDVHLILIGEGLTWNYCKNLSDSLGLQKYTSFLGFVESKELSKYYASSDIFVFPSELEGFGQVILESMASGTPVICANKPPMSEIVSDGGLTFHINDSRDLSRKILYLLNNRKFLINLRKRSLDIVKTYDLLNIAKQYNNYLKEVIINNYSKKLKK